jgi:hypothetical protein
MGIVSSTLGRIRTRVRRPRGRRLHRLEPDPIAAPMVQRIFADYCKGVGLFAIAQVLTREELAGALDDAGSPGRA